MTTGAYEDAIKAFINGDSVEETAESNYQKARCFVALRDLDQAVEMTERTIELYTDDMLVNVDL